MQVPFLLCGFSALTFLLPPHTHALTLPSNVKLNASPPQTYNRVIHHHYSNSNNPPFYSHPTSSFSSFSSSFSSSSSSSSSTSTSTSLPSTLAISLDEPLIITGKISGLPYSTSASMLRNHAPPPLLARLIKSVLVVGVRFAWYYFLITTFVTLVKSTSLYKNLENGRDKSTSTSTSTSTSMRDYARLDVDEDYYDDDEYESDASPNRSITKAKAKSHNLNNPVAQIARMVLLVPPRILSAVSTVFSSSYKILSSALSLITPSIIHHHFRLTTGKVDRLANYVCRKTLQKAFPPNPINLRKDEWGVATLAKKQEMDKSGYVKYLFELPNRGDSLNLSLGQSLSLCCLDKKNNVVKGDFYVRGRNKRGGFEVVGMSCGKTKEQTTHIESVLGREDAMFHRTLSKTVKIGDEMAIKPGKTNLEYRGEHLPVTDMVFVVSGLGVEAVLDQLKEILPTTKLSSVKTCSVIWVNERTEEFKFAFEQLEREFYKYEKKLEVSCVLMNDIYSNSMPDSEQLGESVPVFEDGTMAVVSGPDYFVKKANSFLVGQKGYPSDVICAM